MVGHLHHGVVWWGDDLAALAYAASCIQPVREAALVRRCRLALETTLLHEKADLLVQSVGGTAAKWCIE